MSYLELRPLGRKVFSVLIQYRSRSYLVRSSSCCSITCMVMLLKLCCAKCLYMGLPVCCERWFLWCLNLSLRFCPVCPTYCLLQVLHVIK